MAAEAAMLKDTNKMILGLPMSHEKRDKKLRRPKRLQAKHRSKETQENSESETNINDELITPAQFTSKRQNEQNRQTERDPDEDTRPRYLKRNTVSIPLSERIWGGTDDETAADMPNRS